jgi:hypothetical protein
MLHESTIWNVVKLFWAWNNSHKGHIFKFPSMPFIHCYSVLKYLYLQELHMEERGKNRWFLSQYTCDFCIFSTWGIHPEYMLIQFPSKQTEK